MSEMGVFLLADIEDVIDAYDDGKIPHSRERPASYTALQRIKEIIYTGKQKTQLFRSEFRPCDHMGI